MSTKAHAAKKGAYKGTYMTQAAVAKLLGISRPRVHQIETNALAKLRQSPILRDAMREAGIRIPSPS